MGILSTFGMYGWKKCLTQADFLKDYSKPPDKILIIRNIAHKSFGLKALQLYPDDPIDNRIYGSSFDLRLEGFVLDIEQTFSIRISPTCLKIPFSLDEIVSMINDLQEQVKDY